MKDSNLSEFDKADDEWNYEDSLRKFKSKVFFDIDNEFGPYGPLCDVDEFKANVDRCDFVFLDYSMNIDSLHNKFKKMLDEIDKEKEDYRKKLIIFSQKMERIISSFENFYFSIYKEIINCYDRMIDGYMIHKIGSPGSFHEVQFIGIGYIPYKLPNYDKYHKTILNFDVKELIKPIIKFPYHIWLSKDPILINFDSFDSNLVGFVNHLILQYISSVPKNKIKLVLLDFNDSNEFDFVSIYSNEYLKKHDLITIVKNKEEFEDILDTLSAKMNEIYKEKLCPTDCSNIFEYNEIFKENTQEIYLMVYVNCPKYLNPSLEAKFEGLLKFNDTLGIGIYSFILNNTNYKLDDDSYPYNSKMYEKFISRISSNSYVIDYNSKSASFAISGNELVPYHLVDKNDVDQFCKERSWFDNDDDEI